MNNIISIDHQFEVPVSKLWEAITMPTEMKQWYFDWADFKAEPGFKFTFPGGPAPDRMYTHLCELKEVIPNQKLSYSWAYEGYEGSSLVTFEISGDEERCTLHFTHEGIDTFPASNPDLAIANFIEGWNHIINFSLNNFLTHKN